MKIDLIFTVCVCTYKNIEQLEQTLCSIANQDYKLIQLIISDDCSSENDENTKNYLQKLVSKHKNRFCDVIINVNRENLGTVKNINTILPYIKGEIVTLMGAGDEFADNGVATNIVKCFLADKTVEFVVSKVALVLTNGKKCYQPDKRYRKALMASDVDRLLQLESRGYCQLCSIGSFYRRSVYEKYGKYDERFVLLEDAPFSYKLLLQKSKVGYFDGITCLHYAGGISNSKCKNMTLERDSINTILYLKYPNCSKLDRFTQRVVEFKKTVRADKKLIQGCIAYPDAACYILVEVIKDWIRRGRYLR